MTKRTPPAKGLDNSSTGRHQGAAAPSRAGLVLAFGAALVAGILIIWYAARRTESPVVFQAPVAEGVATVETQVSLRPPTTTLVTTPVPATAEQLQQEAEATADELVSRYPDLPDALHVAAMANSQLRRTAEAERLWKKCIELSSGNEHYYVNLAAVAIDRGNSELAVATLEQARALGTASPELLHHLAIALTNLGRLTEAEAVAKEALTKMPDSAAHWLVLGQAQLELAHHLEAEASLRKAVDLGAQSASVYFALGNALARQGKKNEAGEFFEHYRERKIARPLDRQRRFDILSMEDARRTAVVVFTEAALVHSRQRDTLEAERLLLRAVALDPSSIPACNAIAALYRGAGMPAEERVARTRLTELAPDDLGNFIELARVCAELGEQESAEAAMKTAISVRPQDHVAYAMLAEFHLTAGRATKARWYAQESIRRQETAEGYLLLASTCKALGDDETAEQAFQLARRLQTNAPPINTSPSTVNNRLENR